MNSLTTRSPGQTETQEITVRSLCLGNQLWADDCLGNAVAGHIRQFTPPDVEVQCARRAVSVWGSYMSGVSWWLTPW